jgi:Ras GTPase-activating-like protein IQGAP2/3
MRTIERSVTKIPFGIRYIAGEINHCLKVVCRTTLEANLETISQISEENGLKSVANFIYCRYLNSAIKAPESWGVVESVPTPKQRKNLSMISKMLTHIAGGKTFNVEDEMLQSLSDYVIHESQQMVGIFKNGSTVWDEINIVIDIIEPEEHFAIDQYDDLASTQKPTLSIRQSDVKYVHALVSKELEVMVVCPLRYFV